MKWIAAVPKVLFRDLELVKSCQYVDSYEIYDIYDLANTVVLHLKSNVFARLRKSCLMGQV